MINLKNSLEFYNGILQQLFMLNTLFSSGWHKGAVPRRGLCGQEQWPAVPRPVAGHVQGHPQPHQTAVPWGQPSQSQPEEAPNCWLSVQSLRRYTDEEPAHQEPKLHPVKLFKWSPNEFNGAINWNFVCTAKVQILVMWRDLSPSSST